MSQPVEISFEFFPPKTPHGQEKLRAVRDELAELSPSFFSATDGAGGSTQERTFNTVMEMSETGIKIAPHLACIGCSTDNLKDLLNKYKEKGIDRIIAVRGDLPSGMGAPGEFRYANDLIEFIRKETGDHFYLDVAAYPETHPQADSFEDDLRNFKKKVDAGANSAITQYFYNPDAYFHFADRCQQLGIDIPIIPGVMPITNYSNLVRFSESCGAEIPRWLRRQLESYRDDSASIRQLGEEVVSRLCERLIAGGAPSLHIYTLNQVEPNKAICKNLGL